MSRLADLRAAILADLDNDEPRLVYADALQAAGDPQGELITIQCELARLGCEHTGLVTAHDDDPEADWLADATAAGDRSRIVHLRARERVLLAAHREAWAGGVRRSRFARGFVEHASLHSEGHQDELFARAPFVRSLDLWGPTVSEVAANRLAQLRRAGMFTESDDASRFLATHARELVQLRHLDLWDHQVADLVTSPLALQLDVLRVAGVPPRLAALLKVARIRDLRIRGTAQPYREADFAELYSCAGLQHLTTLSLTGCKLRETIADLLHSLDKLTILQLQEDDRHWLDVVAPAIARLPTLRVLDLSSSNPTPGQLSAVLSGPSSTLATLRLAYCGLARDHVRALVDAPGFARLRAIDLSINDKLDDTDVVEALLASPHGSPLELLILSRDLQPDDLARLRVTFPQLEVWVV